MVASCPACGGTRELALREAAAAIAADDVDVALDAGLLAWNGCTICASRQGLSPAEITALHAARDFRLRALAARDRYRSRTQRLQRLSEERALRRPSAGQDAASSLPAAAAIALARAKARAAQKKIP